MKKRKFGILTMGIILLIFTLTSIAFTNKSQESDRQRPPRDNASEPGMREITGVLDLSNEQKEQLQTILKDHQRESRDELFDKVLPILNEDQQNLLAGIKSDLKKNKMPRSIIENRIRRMDKQLELNENQKKQLSEVFSEFGDEMLQIRNNGGDREQMKEKFNSLHSRLETILSPGQMEKMDKMNMKRRGKFNRRMAHRDGQRMLEQLKNELDLNPDQEALIEKILKESRSTFREEMKNIDDPEVKNEVFQSHREDVAQQIARVLNDEQKVEFDKMKDEFDKQPRGHRNNRPQ